MKTRRARLKLVVEHKISDLLNPPPAVKRLEASGIKQAAGRYFVVFDNMTPVAAIDANLDRTKSNRLLGPALKKEGFEDIAYDEREHRFFLLHEAIHRRKGSFNARIVESGADFVAQADHRVKFAFDGSNKGYEGLTCIYRGNQRFLLALCEGNKCCGKKKGRKPGNGRIHVLDRQGDRWQRIDRLKLPKSVEFEDYSGMDLRDRRLAVVSQASSALWIGRLAKQRWAFDGHGTLYTFPRDRNHRRVYCNVEGVTWVNDHRIAVVSDRCKRGNDPQPKRCRAKEQSLHIFDIPGG